MKSAEVMLNMGKFKSDQVSVGMEDTKSRIRQFFCVNYHVLKNPCPYL